MDTCISTNRASLCISLTCRMTRLTEERCETAPIRMGFCYQGLTPYRLLQKRSKSRSLTYLATRTSLKVRSRAFNDSNVPQNHGRIVWPSPDDKIPFWQVQFPVCEKPVSKAGNTTEQDSDVMHVVHVTAEMAPIAKVGGLGDVVTGLARSCQLRGHKVEVMVPFYECLPRGEIENLSLSDSYSSYFNGNWVTTHAYRGLVTGIPVIFIEPSNHFFKGANIYGGSYNELEAYLFFSRACLELMQVKGFQPDIIHVHEWQISALPLLYWDMYYKLSVKKPRIVLTIHNMEHYGECRIEQFGCCGLDGSIYSTTDKKSGITLQTISKIPDILHLSNLALDDRTKGHNPERLSLLKGGIVYSNAVTTVSPTYVKETLCSGWLSNTLMQYHGKYFGILNGIDTLLWDPSTDRFLPFHFQAEDLEGKEMCKQYVQRGLGLEPDTIPGYQKNGEVERRSPLVVCITRLVAQKGLHLIRHAMNHVTQMDGQFILLGTAPDGRVQREFEQLASQYKMSKSVRLLLTYSEELSHILYAAADFILVPSMYEPCGLAQMIGMRYGAIPIVRKTGGLADTVFDMHQNQSNNQKPNGFVFEGIDEGSLNSALERAFLYYKESPEKWKSLVSENMKIDSSWDRSAKQYIKLYKSIRVR